MLQAPVCLKCSVRMKCSKTGARIFECKEAPKESPEDIKDQVAKVRKVWSADLFTCPSCRAEIVGGWADTPMAEEHQPELIEEYLRIPSIKHFFVEK